MNRNSVVNKLRINDIFLSSVLNIGDTVHAEPYLKAIAVQQEGAYFLPHSYSFEQYPIFTRPFPYLAGEPEINQAHIHHDDNIQVDAIRIIGASGSSIIHIGTLENLDARARVKHIRILRD